MSLNLSIIIVSWNVRDLLADCLRSIAAAPVTIIPAGAHPPEDSESPFTVEVIVVDSASDDGSAYMLRNSFPWVRLVAETENIGFTRGNNAGLEIAQGRHLMLLNPDTVIHGDALNQLASYLDTHPDVGIVGPQVLNDDGTTQSTRRRFPTPLTAIFESTWLQPVAPQRLLDAFYVADQRDDDIFDVDWVQGCALVARRATYDSIGPLDTGYVMYSEELDWCKRAKSAGWRVVYVGVARITHYGGKSADQAQAQKHIYFQQSKIRYFRKFHGFGMAVVLRIFLLASYLIQIALESAKAAVGHKRSMRRNRIATYIKVVRALVGGAYP